MEAVRGLGRLAARAPDGLPATLRHVRCPSRGSPCTCNLPHSAAAWFCLHLSELRRGDAVTLQSLQSTHRLFNTPRRKENQVYTAEEKAALAMFNFEENKRKEAKILEEMRRLVSAGRVAFGWLGCGWGRLLGASGR